MIYYFRVKNKPKKNARSEFVHQADQELDNWIEHKASGNLSEMMSNFTFRIIEPIFRIKSKELNSGLY